MQSEFCHLTFAILFIVCIFFCRSRLYKDNSTGKQKHNELFRVIEEQDDSQKNINNSTDTFTVLPQ